MRDEHQLAMTRIDFTCTWYNLYTNASNETEDRFVALGVKKNISIFLNSSHHLLTVGG